MRASGQNLSFVSWLKDPNQKNYNPCAKKSFDIIGEDKGWLNKTYNKP